MNAPQTGLQPFHAMEILAEAKVLESEGRTILHLEVGEPAVPPAPQVIEAVRRALPDAQRYTHAKGQRELREALGQFYHEQHAVELDPERIAITMGSSAGFVLAFAAAFQPGATIAVTRPGYPAYLNTLAGLGYKTVEIGLDAASGWRLSAAEIEVAHQQTPFEGLLFASPANPTGAAVDRAALRAIAQTCTRLGVRLISDEIYHRLDYRAPSVSALEVTDDAVVINSFSKYYCMTGWRVGWMVLPPDLVRRTEMLAQNLFISAPTLSQIGAEAALGATAYYEQQKQHYAQNRQLLMAGLRDLGFSLPGAPEGAFYAYADASRFTNDTMSFCTALLREAGIASAPGLDFDRTDGNRFVRFSYAGSRETIERALERMAEYLPRF